MPEARLSDEEALALAEFLHRIPLFADLRPPDLDALVQLVEKEEYPIGSILYRQSDADGSLYVIYAGIVELTHIDPQGAPNNVGTRGPGDWLGESSALLGEPHDVTALAQTPVTVLVFTRSDFTALIAGDPGFKGRLSPKDENARKLNAPQYGWQAADESVVVFTREHPWSLIRVIGLPVILAVGALGLALYLIFTSAATATLGLVFLGLFVLLVLGAFSYLIADWRNDYYVVTNKRVVHIDELPIIRKRREEAPLSAVSEIQFARNSIVAQLLDFGDLRVETFSGMVAMKDIPHPNEVKDLIQREIERVKARARASERNAIRDELTKRIITQEVPKDQPAAPAPPTSSVRSVLPGLVRYFFPRLREEQNGAIIWRKHWILLWKTSWPPFVALLFTVWAMINWLNVWFPFGGLPDSIWWMWPIPLGIFFAWWLWLFEDWRNDLYILTGTRIIDIERVPFLLSENRRETTLSKIQTTEIKIPTPLARFLRFGDLIIRVPGAVFEFKSIPDPAGAQTDINKRLAEFQKRVAENEARGRRNELSDWFAAYDQIRQPLAPRAAQPEPAAGGNGTDGSS